MSSPTLAPLHAMTLTTPTRFWNDSCAEDELDYAIGHGAVGATSNPSIVLAVLKKELPRWREPVLQAMRDHPTWSEIQIAWHIYEAVAANGARRLLPVFEHANGCQGRLSIQTDPALYRDAGAILEQGRRFDSLLPNIQVKVPATQAGVAMIEEATYLGININATVSFTVAQALAVGEAVQRGLDRRQAEGKPTANMSPVCTLMIGRLDDWLKVLVQRDGAAIDPESLEWAGLACFKRSYQLYQRRGYQCRLLAAAFRNRIHWTELVGGEVSLTIPYAWQLKYNQSGLSPEPRIGRPVPLEHLAAPQQLPEFQRAYLLDGQTPADFDTYGPTVRTLRGFIQGWHDFVAIIRDIMLPNPDLPPA